MTYFGVLLILALASGRAAYALSKDEIFRPVREWVWLRSAPESSDILERTDDGDVSHPARMYHLMPERVKCVAPEDETGTCADYDEFEDYVFEPNEPLRRPGFFGQLIECVFCLTFWTSLLAVIGWQLAPELTLSLATPLAVWAVANWFAAKAL